MRGQAEVVSANDLNMRRQWVKRNLIETKVENNLPFSFVYGGQPSSALLATWRRSDETKKLDQHRVQRTTRWTDQKTMLEVRCVSVEYLKFPTVEWTLYFKNRGKQDTPILENLQALDTRFERGENGEFLLHHAVGSPCQPNDYQPLETVLGQKAQKRISAAGGRPTNSDLCYFNLEWPGQGVILAFGWPGQWTANFVREDTNAVHVTGGQELTHFKLFPGEEARSPLVALQFWKGGDWVRAQNVWRRWMVAHNLPRPGGKLVSTHYGSCWSIDLNPSAEEEMAIIKGFEREGIKLDYYFIDAGWYPHPGGGWPQTGTWEIDAQRFPHGIREISDHLHEKGTKFVLWFEPERVTDGSWLAVNHPDWILKGDGGWLLNLGNPETWKWAVEKISGLLTSQSIDVYREDFNMDPLTCWRTAEAPDRQGVTEMRHVEGHLALWDEILRRHPDLFIDSCASGGRRNDLETLRRSVPLLRSDCFSPAEVQQAQTMGIAPWMPYYGSGMYPADVYWYRSCIFPASRVGMDTRKPEHDYALLKKMMAEFHRVEKYLLGDFYPLTPYSLALDVWAAWQFDRPEMGEGIVQAFRRDESPNETARFRLRGLRPEATYCLKDFDKPDPVEAIGKDLMESGLQISLPQRRSSCILQYQRVK
ncbi:MAG: alpha-galactosidase [Armatimonadetes bacterium]|nr:alpha-galactosidase [Armatimonadota bacterium]